MHRPESRRGREAERFMAPAAVRTQLRTIWPRTETAILRLMRHPLCRCPRPRSGRWMRADGGLRKPPPPVEQAYRSTARVGHSLRFELRADCRQHSARDPRVLSAGGRSIFGSVGESARAVSTGHDWTESITLACQAISVLGTTRRSSTFVKRSGVRRRTAGGRSTHGQIRTSRARVLTHRHRSMRAGLGNCDRPPQRGCGWASLVISLV